jgi:hypothetical protein
LDGREEADKEIDQPKVAQDHPGTNVMNTTFQNIGKI